MPRNENYEAMLDANSTSHRDAAKMRAKKAEIHHLELFPAHNAKHHDADGKPMHTVEHHFNNSGPGPYKEHESHHFSQSEGKELLAHVAKHMKLNVKGDEAADEETEGGKGSAAGAAY